MGTTIHFKILKYGNKVWWDQAATRLNVFHDRYFSGTEPMRSISDYKKGWTFVKTYAEQPYHDKVKNMLKNAARHGFVIKIHDELDGEERIFRRRNLGRG